MVDEVGVGGRGAVGTRGGCHYANQEPGAGARATWRASCVDTEAIPAEPLACGRPEEQEWMGETAKDAPGPDHVVEGGPGLVAQVEGAAVIGGPDEIVEFLHWSLSLERRGRGRYKPNY